MWGRIVSSVSNALDFNQATLSGCIDIICVRNPHTGELHSTPFHVRFGKAKLLRSREKIVTVMVNNNPTGLVMKLGAAGEAYFMQEVEDSIGVAEEELASPLCSPVHSPRRVRNLPAEASVSPSPHNSQSLPPSHPLQGTTLSTAASAVAADSRKTADSVQEPAKNNVNVSPSSGVEGLPSREGPPSSQSVDASSTWRSAWGTAARYEATTAGMSERSPTGSFTDGEAAGAGRGEEGRAAVQFSLCGHVLFGTADEAQHDADVFKANLVTWEALEENPSLWYHPSLVACFERTPPYYPAKVALPLLASWLMFNRPLSLNSVKRLMTAEITYTDREGAAWALWQTDGVGSASGILRPRLEPLSSSDFSQSSPGRDQLQGATCSSGINSDSEFPSLVPSTPPSSGKRLRRSLRPTPQQLESLDLKPGANSVCFTVSSSLQGEKSVCGTIYLWPIDIKIVVSDVDGTITRSDVLGQLMPIVGRDWSHTGVAELFTKIKKSGYLILYLTARAIGQADATRDYLFGLTQKERDKLPDGPLILSPDRLFPSFRREVIDRKPYIFKIAALRDIRSLFPANRNPFYAGFGNRESDHRAYIHVGIPEAKIFIIDTAGVIHHISNSTYARTYETMSEIADYMFPPLKDSPVARGQKAQDMEEREEEEFNAFNYWSMALEPRSEYGDSEGGSGDEAECPVAAVATAPILTIGAETSSHLASTGLQQQQALRCSGGGPLALNYYFGLDQTDGVRSPSAGSRTQAARAEACLPSRGASDSSDASDDTFGAGNSSSSSSSSSSLQRESLLLLEESRSLPRGLLFSPQRGPFSQQQPECLRRTASEGAGLAALDCDHEESSCPEQQQHQHQEPITATAPGILLLPSVVSLSSFRLGPLAFRRGVASAGAATSLSLEDATGTATRAAAAPAPKESAQPSIVAADAAQSNSRESSVYRSGGEQIARDVLSSGSRSSSRSSFFLAASAVPERLQGRGLPAPVSAVPFPVDDPQASNAIVATAAAEDITGVGAGADLARATVINRQLPMHTTSSAVAHTANTRGCKSGKLQNPSACRSIQADALLSCQSSTGSSNNGNTSLPPFLAATPAAEIGTPANIGSENVATAEIRFTAAAASAVPSTLQNLTVPPCTSRKSRSVSPPVFVPAAGETRVWLPRSPREMHACSSTSAMFMALAEDVSRHTRPPNPPHGEATRYSFNPISAGGRTVSKTGIATARAAGGKSPVSTWGSTEGFGSYTSFESADPTTSRCDSFASVASRCRTDDETHMRQYRQKQKQELEVEEQQKKAEQGNDADADVPVAASKEAQDTEVTSAAAGTAATVATAATGCLGLI